MGPVHNKVILTFDLDIMTFNFEIFFANSCSTQLRGIQCQRYILLFQLGLGSMLCMHIIEYKIGVGYILKTATPRLR